MKDPLIEIKKITKVYQMGDMPLRVLKDIDLQIEEGEYVAIWGPSGSGKSTLMNIIGCIDIQTEGEYILDGHNISEADEDQQAQIRNMTVGFIFQNFNLLGKYTALHNVEMPLLIRGLAEEEAFLPAQEALEKVGLQERINHYPKELSGGQQQRVSIARALVARPRILLADEPTGALDSKTSEEIMDLIDELHKAGHTIILITHEKEIAERAKRVIYLTDGKIEREEIK